MVSGEKCWCVICHKFLIRYTPKYNMCQKCYREMLLNFGYYKYKSEKVKPKKDTSAYKICEIARLENLRPKNIVEKYGNELNVKNVAYVRSILNMYMERCDTMEEPKPKKGEEQRLLVVEKL